MVKKIIIGGIVVIIVIVGYWLISPLFIKTVSDEKLTDLPSQTTGPEVLSRGNFTDGEPGHYASEAFET